MDKILEFTNTLSNYITIFLNYILSWIPIILIILNIVIVNRIAKRRRLKMEQLKKESEYENMKNAYKDALREYNKEKESN